MSSDPTEPRSPKQRLTLSDGTDAAPAAGTAAAAAGMGRNEAAAKRNEAAAKLRQITVNTDDEK